MHAGRRRVRPARPASSPATFLNKVSNQRGFLQALAGGADSIPRPVAGRRGATRPPIRYVIRLVNLSRKGVQDGTLPLSRCKYKCIFYTHKIFPAIKLILVKKWWRLLKKLAFVLPAARLSGRCGGLVCRRHGGRRPWLWRLSAHAHATPCGTGRCGRPSFARRKAVDCDAKGRVSQHETRPFVFS